MPLYVTHNNCEKELVFFLAGDSPASELYMPTFRNTLFHLHRWKNNWDEIVMVFIREKFGWN